MTDALRDQTIADFGDQWTTYTDNSGYYGSAAYLANVFGPLLPACNPAGKQVADVGAGTGRFTRIFVEAGATRVVAVEPSAAFEVLRRNTAEYATRIEYLNVLGEALPAGALDIVFSIGVLHHIPDPLPVVRAACNALRPGGRVAVWVYGREGNGLYLAVTVPLRALTRRMPHALLAALVRPLDVILVIYAVLCRWLPLPLRGYMREVIARLDGGKRRLVIYDQLNPAYARYYRREEVRDLLVAGGFTSISLYHRHGYSWAAVAAKP